MSDQKLFGGLIKILEDKKILAISIDPGFDQFKIIINDAAYSSTGKTVEYNDNYFLSSIPRTDLIMTDFSDTDITKNFLIGDCVETILTNNTNVREEYEKYGNDEIDTSIEKRFASEEFKIALKGNLALAIYTYFNDKNLDISKLSDYTIITGIALPHSMFCEIGKNPNSNAKKLSDIIIYSLTYSNNYNLKIGGESINIKLDIPVDNISFNSQAVCLLFEYGSPDGVSLNSELKFPIVLIDGGYKTIGIICMVEGFSVEFEESNTDFAMYNINKMTANKINEIVKEPLYFVEHYQIDNIIKKNESVGYLNSEGKYEDVNPYEIKQEVLSNTCSNLVNYLLDNLQQLVKTKTIIAGGGTGTAYYKMLEKFITKERPNINLVNVTPTLGSKQLEPIFAISAGMHKSLVHNITIQL